MKNIITTALCVALLAGCGSSAPKDLDPYTTDYSISRNQFGVVVAEDDGISRSEAQKYAMQKAARVAHEHGYRYFMIDRETEIVMMKGSQNSPQQEMPKNMYYSKIQSGDFGKDRMESSDLNPVKEVSGYQIEFSCHENKPDSGKYFDVCQYGACE
jgi:hypothetical protein